jgi:hypothetical protein
LSGAGQARPRIVIAHFRTGKAWQQNIVILSVILLPACLTFFFGADIFGGFKHGGAHGFLLFPLLLMWFLVPFIIPHWLAVFRQLAFDGGTALWIEDGFLIYVRKWMICAPCAEITEVYKGIWIFNTITDVEAIVVRLKNGRVVKYTTGSYAESREEVIARLNDVLNLPPSTRTDPDEEL